MKIKNRKLSQFLLVLLLSLGCVYYNTFYNAEQYFGDAMKLIEESPSVDDEIPANAKKLLDSAIQKSNLVLEKYPDSKYVDDAFFIIGQASFLKGENSRAERYFKRLIHEYPDSPYLSECEIWLAYSHFRMGFVDSARTQISHLLENNPKMKSDKYLIYKIMGEIELERDSLKSAFTYLEEAASYANTDSKRAYIFNKLVALAEESEDYPSAIYFLEQLSLYTTNIQVLDDAKLKWYDYNRKIGNYGTVKAELDNELSGELTDTKRLTLELERAKNSLESRDFVNAHDELVEILENPKNKRKKETAEAAYIMGNLALTEDFDLPRAIMFFDSAMVVNNRNRFKTEIRDLTKKIESYQSLEASYEIARKKAQEPEAAEEAIVEEVVITDSLVVETDAEKTPDEAPGFDLFGDLEDENTAGKPIIAPPDSLLFTLSEMLLFEFNQNDRGLDKYTELVTEYPDSKFAPQSLYVLSHYLPDADQNWSQVLKDRFPQSIYAQGTIDTVDESAKAGQDPVEKLRDDAWTQLLNSPESARNTFESIARDHKDPDAAYITAFITDSYLNSIYDAVLYYQAYLDSFPEHTFQADASRRLTDIQSAIESRQSEVVGYYYLMSSGVRISAADSQFVAISDPDTVMFTARLDSITVSGVGPATKLFAGIRQIQYQVRQDTIVTIRLVDLININTVDSSVFVFSDLDTLLTADWDAPLSIASSAESVEIFWLNDSLKLKLYDDSLVYDPKEFSHILALLVDETADTTAVDSLEQAVADSLHILDADSLAVLPADSTFILSDSNIPTAVAPSVIDLNIPNSLIVETLQSVDDSLVAEILKNKETDSTIVTIADTDTLLKSPETVADSILDIPDTTFIPHSVASEELTDVDILPDSTRGKTVENISEGHQTVWVDYLIKPGDMLTTIAQAEYEDHRRWVDIYEWNRQSIGDNPNRIYPYNNLQLQKKASAHIPIDESLEIYIVKAGDTLWSIAEDVYADPKAWIILFIDNEQLLDESGGLLQPDMEISVRKNLR